VARAGKPAPATINTRENILLFIFFLSLSVLASAASGFGIGLAVHRQISVAFARDIRHGVF